MRTRAYGAASLQGAWPVLEEFAYGDPGKSHYFILDGMGGPGIGDVAIQYTSQLLKEILSESVDVKHASTPISGISLDEKRLHIVGEKIHHALWVKNKGAPISQRAALSMIGASVSKRNIVQIWNFGACHAYVFRQNSFHLISQGQLWELPAEGLLLPRQALGLDNALLPELRSFTALPGDILLLHSSGFSLQFPGVAEYLQQAFGNRAAGENMEALAQGVLAEFAAASAFYNQSLLLLEL